MFCRYCGSKLKDGVKFCTNCGQNVLSTSQMAQSPATSQMPSQYNRFPYPPPAAPIVADNTANTVHTQAVILCFISLICCLFPFFNVLESKPINDVLDFFDMDSVSFSLFTFFKIANKNK